MCWAQWETLSSLILNEPRALLKPSLESLFPLIFKHGSTLPALQDSWELPGITWHFLNAPHSWPPPHTHTLISSSFSLLLWVPESVSFCLHADLQKWGFWNQTWGGGRENPGWLPGRGGGDSAFSFIPLPPNPNITDQKAEPIREFYWKLGVPGEELDVLLG